MGQGQAIRAGAVENGRIFEQKMAALLATRMSLDNDVKDFWMLSNIEQAGAFDDLVISVESSDEKRILYFMQLKHLDNEELIMGWLEDPNKKKFYMPKYEESFKLIRTQLGKDGIFVSFSEADINLILYTNAKLKQKCRRLIARSVKGSDLMVTSKTAGAVIQLDNKELENKFLDDHFLSKFSLYSRQANAAGLDRMIRNELYSHFRDIHNTSIFSVSHFFTRWSLGRKKQITKLTKRNMQLILLEVILTPHVMDPTSAVDANTSVAELLRKTLLNFNVISVSEARLLKNIFQIIKQIIEDVCEIQIQVQNSFNTNLSQEQLDVVFKRTDDTRKEMIATILRERSNYQPHMTVKDLYLAAWQCRFVPLIINCEQSPDTIKNCFLKFKNVISELSFVLLNPSFDLDLQSVTVFRKINDICDLELLSQNLKNMTISFQGKPKVALSYFANNSRIIDTITPDIFLMLMDKTYQIGRHNEIESYYVKRNIVLPRVKMEIIERKNVFLSVDPLSNEKKDIFIIIKPDNLLVLLHYKYAMDMGLYCSDIKSNLKKDTYILTTDETNVNHIKTTVHAIEKLTDSSIHILEYLDKNAFQWIYTLGSIRTVHKFVIEKDSDSRNVSEDKIVNYGHSKLNILSNNAGMGKTMFLKNLANHYCASTWVTYVNLSDHSAQISKILNLGEFVDYIFGYETKGQDAFMKDFCESVFLNCIYTQEFVYMLDGYDEIASTESLAFLKAVVTSNLGKTWITTRPTYKHDLETTFDILAMEISQLSDQDYQQFVRAYLEFKGGTFQLSDSQIDQIVDSVDICSRRMDKSFVRMPLQTKMLAEVFADDYHKVEKKGSINIVELYDAFIDIKLREYKSYEANSLRRTVSKLALKLFYKPELLEDIIEYDELLEDIPAFQDSYKKDTIVTGIKENGDAYFGHRTYAEFLAAQWIFKRITNKKPKNIDKWLSLARKLFYNELEPVRVFFDRIAGFGMPLHTAVLNDDVGDVIELMKDESNLLSKDALGRNALHVAASHGEFYDVIYPQSIEGIKFVGIHAQVTELNDNIRITLPRPEKCQVSLEVFDKLLDLRLVDDKSNIFQLDVFDHAKITCSLKVQERLLKEYGREDLDYADHINMKLLIYCVAYLNLHNILSNQKTFDFYDQREMSPCKLRNVFEEKCDFLKMKYVDMYLTELAASQGSNEVIYILISAGVLDISLGSPVHKASLNGQADTLELLHKLGANIDSFDADGIAPMFRGNQRGDVTYMLLSMLLGENKIKTKYSSSPLHYCCQGGHLEAVRKLISLGVDVTIKDSHGYSSLFYAAMYGYYDIIGIILSTRQYVSDEIQKALDIACANNYVKCAQEILKYINDVNQENSEGYTPLMTACANGQSNIVELLSSVEGCMLDKLNVQETSDKVLRWAQGHHHVGLSVKMIVLGKLGMNKGGLAAMHYAIMKGYTGCVKILLEANADPNIQDELPGFGYTPLVWACMYGQEAIVELLMQYTTDNNVARLALSWAAVLGYSGCVRNILSSNILPFSTAEPNKKLQKFYEAELSLNIRSVDLTHYNLALLAGKNGHVSVIEELVSSGFTTQNDLNNGLRWAAQNGDVNCVRCLINLGADEHSTDHIPGLSLIPLAYACMYGKLEVVKYLLENKTADYLQNYKVHYALNWAAMGGYLEIVKILLKFGFHVNNVDSEGNTPLAFACCYRGTKEVVEELLSFDCDIYVKNNKGKMAIEEAIGRSEFSIAHILLMKLSTDMVDVIPGTLLYTSLQTYLRWATINNQYEIVAKINSLGVKDL